MNKKSIFIRLIMYSTLGFLGIAQVNAQSRSSDWGMHRIWGERVLDEQPAVVGTFVVAEWKEVNPQPGKFDFSIFDQQLERVSRLGKPVTVAIRGGNKPDFLYTEVPYHPEELGRGVHDAKGTLQYWHPTYRQRYREVLQAFSAYLRSSPYRSTVYSIRQSVNAIGTEASGVPDDKTAMNQWIIPAGATFVPYSAAQDIDYKRFVTQTYFDLFADDVLLLVRSVLFTTDSANEIVPAEVRRAVELGQVGLMHTSSVPEPTRASTERKYLVHAKYGREGVTPVYAEPYAGSDYGPQPPAQWNYWRILSDLHVGVTYLAVYGREIAQIGNAEYAAAFEFANRYSGYQTRNSAASSPGAWVALREGGEFLRGDYTFLMSRMSGDPNVAVDSVGPSSQRFGAWARKVNAGDRMRFQLDDRFANSLGSGQAPVRVVYFDSQSPRFTVVTPTARSEIVGGGTGTWKVVEFLTSAPALSGNSGADITVEASTAVTLHMVEVMRDSGSNGSVVVAPPKSPNLVSVD
jgi:hypothetical protein